MASFTTGVIHSGAAARASRNASSAFRGSPRFRSAAPRLFVS